MHSDWSCVFLDTETTGLDPKVDRVVSYSLRTWSLDNGKGAEQSALILPPYDTPVNAEAARVNGYSFDTWYHRGAQTFNWLHVSQICEALTDKIVVGCFPQFDLDMLQVEFNHLVCATFPRVKKRINICDLAAPLLVIGEVKSTSLESLANYFGCNRSGAHTAAGDVDTAIEVWESLLRAFLLKE